MNKPKRKKEKRVRVWVDVGSHGGVFFFEAGPVADRYPKLMHVYKKKISADLKQATLVYKV